MERMFGTCFFEEYAALSLSRLVGHEFDGLVVHDRPDLQSAESGRLGIEVTRAMPESKAAAAALLREMSGALPREDGEDDLARILRSGYAYGLQEGRYIGRLEMDYWSRALPLRRILKSKVEKAANGFYGRYERMGLYVFCKDPLTEVRVANICRYVRDLQRDNDIRYDFLYLSEISELYVCNLADGLGPNARVASFDISPDVRRTLYLDALRRRETAE